MKSSKINSHEMKTSKKPPSLSTLPTNFLNKMKNSLVLSIFVAILFLTGCSKDEYINDPDTQELTSDGISDTDIQSKSAQRLGMGTALSGYLNIYGPEVYTYKGKKRMLFGGWLTQSDLNNGGDDKIYYSEHVNGRWTSPRLAFRSPGDHIHDVSVVKPPSSDGVNRSTWLYMYYTILKDHRNPNTDNNKDNKVGWAISHDGGRTWRNLGVLIGRSNGVDNNGAWAPTAIVNGNQIWLYYQGNHPAFTKKYLTKLNLNGWQKIGRTTVLPINDDLVNIDIKKRNGKYYMLGNSASLRNVYYYESNNGINWRSKQLLIRGGANNVTTPSFDFTSNTNFDLYFGFGTQGSSSEHNSIQQWRYRVR